MRNRSLVALLASIACAAPAAAVDLGDARIRLRHETYDARTGPRPSSTRLPPARLEPSDIDTWIVAFRGPADPVIRDTIEKAGRIVGYVPSNAYLVRGAADDLTRLADRPGVMRVDRYRPEWKIAPSLAGKIGVASLHLQVFDGERPDAVARAAAEAGAEIVAVHEGAGVARVTVRAPADLVPALARISEVEWIEKVGEIGLRNDGVRWVLQSNVLDETPLYDRGLLGTDQIIGHIDNPLDLNSCYFEDPANDTPGPGHRKVVAYRASRGPGAAEHGTHTAGTAAGDAEPITGDTLYRGVAPKARLSFTDLFDVTGLASTPSNLAAMLDSAHTDGARVHSNSWGDILDSTYTTWSRDADLFSRDHEEDLVVFAIANRVGADTPILSPENAKNVLAVAGTLSPPNQNQHGEGRRGPTYDGRRRPEVMSPGRGIRSASFGSPCGSRVLSGTSMSAPGVAGAAALMREYFLDGFHPTGRRDPRDSRTPSGALMKATLVNSAVDLTGVPGYPTVWEGWGRILLDDALFFDGDTRRLWVADVRHAEGLSTGGFLEYRVHVVDTFEPLKITMAFTDVPAALGAALAPVNDLDLEVEGPSGSFLGNVFAADESVTGGTPDALNNVERVVVRVPGRGAWTIRVHATDVPDGPQGFAIAVNGGLFGAAPIEEIAPGQGDGIDPGIPGAYRFDPIEPNPFSDEARVKFAIPETAPVNITVYDVTGRFVSKVLDRPMAAGDYTIQWDGRDENGGRVSPGVYFFRFSSPGLTSTAKAVRLQ